LRFFFFRTLVDVQVVERDLQQKKKFKQMNKKFAMNRGNRRMQQEELVEERRSRER